jgi:hypothetical protein
MVRCTERGSTVPKNTGNTYRTKIWSEPKQKHKKNVLHYMKYRSTKNFVRKKMYLVSIYKFLSFAGTVLLAYLLLFRIILLTYSVSH